jgi:drug/metabolite transporter (DMT)-like permease
VTPASVPGLALASALISAGATILIRRGLRHDGPYTAFWINLAVGTVGLWAAVALGTGLGAPSLQGVALFAAAGLIGTMGGRLLRFIGIETVGASITSALMNLSPLVSSALAIVLLGEDVTLPILGGTLVIVAGTTLLSSGGRSSGVRARQLIVPLLSAVCFGIVAVLRKMGLAGMAPVPGFAVNVTAALIAFTGFLTGSVSVVAPLASVSPIFVLVLSFFFLRGIELLNTRIVVGTVLIVAGVYLITALR